jgi:hypothetical protein
MPDTDLVASMSEAVGVGISLREARGQRRQEAGSVLGASGRDADVVGQSE